MSRVSCDSCRVNLGPNRFPIMRTEVLKGIGKTTGFSYLRTDKIPRSISGWERVVAVYLVPRQTTNFPRTVNKLSLMVLRRRPLGRDPSEPLVTLSLIPTDPLSLLSP